MRQIYRTQVTSEPSALPVTIRETKLFLGMDEDDETQDTDIDRLIRACTTACERYTRRTFINTSWTLWMDRFPGKALPWWNGVRQGADTELTDLTESILLPHPPVSAVTFVKAHTQDGSETTVASANYITDFASEPARVALKISQAWPSDSLRSINGVEVEYVAGYGATAIDVPAPIKQAILEWLHDIHTNRGSSSVKFERVGESAVSHFDPTDMPTKVSALLSTYKIWKL